MPYATIWLVAVKLFKSLSFGSALSDPSACQMDLRAGSHQFEPTEGFPFPPFLIDLHTSMHAQCAVG